MRDISKEWARINRAIEKYEQEGIDEMELAMYEMQLIEGTTEAIFKAVNESLDNAIIRNYEQTRDERVGIGIEISEMERNLRVLEDRQDSLEYHNQCLDEREAGLEKSIQNTKFWQFGERAKLRSELEQVRKEPRMNDRELDDTIRKAKQTLSGLYQKSSQLKSREERLEKEVEKLKKPYQSQSHNMQFRPKRGR